MLAVRTLPTELQLDATVAAPLAPQIVPNAAPSYVPPVSYPLGVAPVISPPPPDQTRGEGGTSFGARPELYGPMIAPRYYPAVEEELYVLNVRERPDTVPVPEVLPPRPGEDSTMPVVTGQQPTKLSTPGATEAVTRPGPITGKVAGFDLARIPLWGWLLGAAFIGSRLLK